MTTGRWKALTALAAALCALPGLWMWRVEGERGRAEAARLLAENQELAKRLEAAERAAAEGPAEDSAAPAAAAAPAEARAAAVSEAARAELLRKLEDRGRALAASEQALGESRSQAEELAARLEQLGIEQRNLEKAEADLKERVDNQVRLAAALQAQLKERGERALELELSNRELRRRLEENAARLTQLARTAGEIDDLSRRREMYMSGILRRYREVTELYRSLTMNSDAVGADQTRIQNAINMAEEDLKQLQALNAQAGRLQRALADARQAAR